MLGSSSQIGGPLAEAVVLSLSNNLGCVMHAYVPTPRDRASGRSKPVLVVLLVAAIGLLFLVELPLPGNMPTGVAEMVPVLIACFYLDKRWSVGILTLAVLTRVAEAILGDTPIELAIVEVESAASQSR